MRQETEDGKSRQEPGLVRRFLAEEDGIGVVEIILIMVEIYFSKYICHLCT